MPTAFITGASKGIGRATAKAFAHAGWDLLLLARSAEDLESLSKELLPTKRTIFYQSVDLSQSEDLSKGIKLLLGRGLQPSVLVNNAGVAWTGALLSMPIEKWNWLLQMNLTSVFQVCSLVVPSMRKKGGLIINISSHAANKVFPDWGAYCVSKAALSSLTKCLVEEERINSIRACTLTLGAVNSSLWDQETVQADFDRNNMLSVDQVAGEILHLANQPANQLIEDLVLMPSGGSF